MQNRISNNWSTGGNLVGQLLVASPLVGREDQSRAVILVLQDNAEGTFGVDLTQPADVETTDAWSKMTGRKLAGQSMVKGGPHGGPVFAIHRYKRIAELTISGGIYVSADSGLLDQLIQAPIESYRIVFGVAAFEIDELLDEIERGIWCLVDVHAEDIFDEPGAIWHNSIRRYGEQTIRKVTGVSRFPKSPGLN